jgi:hypothetical protein
MKVRTLMIAQALVATIVGLVFTFIPAQMLSTYGITSNIALDYMGQLYGAALLGIGVLAWLAKDSTASEAGKAILTGFCVASAIGFVVTLIGQLGGAVNVMGWSTVAIYILFAIGFGYFRFFKS